MKKLFALVLLLVSLWSMTFTVSAASIGTYVSSGHIKPGEKVVVTIKLEGGIDSSEGATMLQGELTYDGSLLEFQQVNKSSQLSHAAKHASEYKVQFHYLSMDNQAVGFSAGNLVEITFKAKDSITGNQVNTALHFTGYIQDADGNAVGSSAYTSAASVTIEKEQPQTEPHVHSWGTGTVTKTATCKEKGLKTYKCSCGQTKTESIALSTTHKYGAWTVVSEATVKAAKVQKHICSVCGKTETQSVGKALEPILEVPGKLNSFSIKKGKTAKFDVTMANGDSVSSVKSSVAKYLNASLDKKTGKITLKGVKKGTSKLTITLASGKSRTYTIKVVTGTVKTSGLSATSVTKNKLTLAVKKSHTLKYELKPFTTTQKVTFKSSNKKIAKVTSGGKITAMAPGKATITMSSGSKKVKITVTVPGITNLKSSVSVKRNKTVTLKPKAYGISGKITYTSSNTKIATVTEKGKVKGIKKGTAKITVRAGTFTKTVTVKVK